MDEEGGVAIPIDFKGLFKGSKRQGYKSTGCLLSSFAGPVRRAGTGRADDMSPWIDRLCIVRSSSKVPGCN